MRTDNNPHPYKVTVVMPALNEERCLAESVANVLDAFARLDIAGELIIVNDGSSDATGSLADGLQRLHRQVSVIHHPHPLGIGAAFWSGVQQAAGEVVVMVPGDGENDAAEILRHLPLMEQVDVVVPFVTNPEVRSWKRRALSFIYGRFITLSFGLSLKYLNGTVMYRRELLAGIELKSGGFFYQAELLIKTLRRGARYKEVPYLLNRRVGGESKATTWRSLVKVLQAYLVVFADVHLSRWKVLLSGLGA